MASYSGQATQMCSHESWLAIQAIYMSNAIAQSATQLVVDTHSEDNYDFGLAAVTAASRQAKGLTRERWTLNRQKLIASVCADYRGRFAAIYGRTDRLPTSVFVKVETAVDSVVNKLLSAVNTANAVSMRRSFAHKPADMLICERVTAVGENSLTLQEQHLGVNLFIGTANRHLNDLIKVGGKLDQEKQVKAQIMRLELTKSFIEGEMKHQAEVQPSA